MADKVLVPATCPVCGSAIHVKVAAPTAATVKATRPARGKTAKRDTATVQIVEAGGTFALRDDAPPEPGAAAPSGRAVEGYVVTWDTPSRPGATVEFPGKRESFARGAFRDWIASRSTPVAIVNDHDGTVVGYADDFEEDDTGLRYRGRLFASQAAADFAERASVLSGVSGEFLFGKYVQRGKDIIHTAVTALGAIAGSYKPAHAGATISVRSDSGGTETMPPETLPGVTAVEIPMDNEGVIRLVRETADEAFRRYAERNDFGRPAVTDPYADLREYPSIGHMAAAAAADGADRELVRWAARALADQLTTDSNAGVTTPQSLTTLRRLVDRGRPAITAFGGPKPLAGVGLTLSFPYYDGTLANLVGEQATQKTEITSAKVEIKSGTAAIKTFAGGSDIAYQLLRRSEPSYLDMYTRILLAAWALVTDKAFVTALEAGTVTVDFTEAIGTVDANELKGWLVDAAVAVDLATGTPAEFALAGTAAFTAAAKLLNPGPVFNAVGTMNLRQLEVNVGGLPIIHDPNVTTGKFIVSNREAAGWHEDGPFQATAEDVAKLGRDVAYWSMGAAAIYVPAAVVEVYDVTP